MARSPELAREMREAAREKILQGSLGVFATKGFHETSMEDVATAAGVSKGLAYLYFRSKDELFVSALRARIEHLFEVGNAVDRTVPAAKRLEQLVNVLFSRVRREPEVFRLYLTMSLDPSMRAVASSSMSALQAPLNHYLKAVRDVFADLGSADPDLDAMIFRSTLLGVFLRYVRSIEDVPIRRISARLVALFTVRKGKK